MKKRNNFEKQLDKLAKTNPIKWLKKCVEYHEQKWRENIKNEKNPMLKEFLKDRKGLEDMAILLYRLEILYGINIEIKIKNEKKSS